MDFKTKILVGVLIVIIIISGLWIFSRQTIEGLKGICGPKVMGPDYDTLHCNRSCKTDDDCRFTCGCGAINKNEICHDEGIIYDCVGHEVKCEKGKCVIGEEKLPTIAELKTCSIDSDCILVETIRGLNYIPTIDDVCGCECVTSINKKFKNLWEQKRDEFKNVECKILCKPCAFVMTNSMAKCKNLQCVVKPVQQVTIITDKTEYEQGDTVEMTIKNNLNSPIWYAQSVRCGASFWLLETCEGEEVPYYEICLWVAPDYRFTKLNPTEILKEEWDGKLWSSDLEEYKLPEPGCYRIVFPYSYSVNKKKLYEDWGEDKRTVYSNEFTIKEKSQQITKEQAIVIANATEEVQEFLKLYPDANVSVGEVEEGYCTVTSKVYGDDAKIDCNLASNKKERGWLVAYYIGDSWEYSKSTAVRIGVDAKTGKILARYPKLEYIRNAKYCESDEDCKYLENCLIPIGVDDFGDTIYEFEGCLNFISGKAYCNYEKEDHFCKCINKTCSIVLNP